MGGNFVAYGGWLPPADDLPEVKALQATCRHCGAEPGERCTRWRRTKRGKVKQIRHSSHPDRVYDAKQATQMARTLLTGDEPDTVKLPW